MLILTSNGNTNSQWLWLLPRNEDNIYHQPIHHADCRYDASRTPATSDGHKDKMENIISVTLLGLRIYGGFINLAY